jgi:hypothetical protein
MKAKRHLLLLATLAVVAPTLGHNVMGQQVAPSATGLVVAPGVTARPDFSGIWRHGNLPWFIPPASGPGPVTNLTREKDTGVSDYNQLVGDFKNPILQPWAAEVVRKKGELSKAGITFPSPSNSCWPEPVPYLFKHMAMQMLQLPDKVVMLFNEDHEVRRVRLNQPHPAKVTPSWYGDAVGHYEGDALVIDTVGVKTDRPHAMIDLFGTPYTDKLACRRTLSAGRLCRGEGRDGARHEGEPARRRTLQPQLCRQVFDGRFHHRGSGRLHHALEGGDDLSARL